MHDHTAHLMHDHTAHLMHDHTAHLMHDHTAHLMHDHTAQRVPTCRRISRTLEHLYIFMVQTIFDFFLGPLLFLIYINNIFKSSNVLSFVLFADDTTVYVQNDSIDSAFEILNT